MPLFHNWSYVNPAIEETWDELREGFGSGDEGELAPVSQQRRGDGEHSLATQVDLFAAAEAVAG